MRVRKFYEKIWWPRCKDRLRECTLAGYRCAWRNWIEPTMGDMDLKDITPRFLDDWLAEQEVPPGVWRITRAFIRVAYRYELVEHDPTKRVLNAPIQGKTEPHTLTRDEMAKLMDGLDGTPVYPIVVCSCTMGLRREEACALLWEDFDWHSGTVAVTKGVQFMHGREVEVEPKTNLSRRVLPLPPETVRRLKPIRGTGRISGQYHVLQIANRYRELCRRRGLPYVPLRNLRTSWCTMLINDGVPVSKVSRYMGHADVETTVRWYTKPRKDELLEVADAWGERGLSAFPVQKKPHAVTPDDRIRPKVYITPSRGQRVIARLLHK